MADQNPQFARTITLPFTPVPITGQTLGVLLVGAAYGPALGVGTVALYLAWDVLRADTGTVAMQEPPSRRMRAISRAAEASSSRCSSVSPVVSASNAPSRNGMRVMSPTTTGMRVPSFRRKCFS